jgi:inner membrane protein
MYRTHVAFAFLIGLFAITFLHPSNQILFMSLVVFAGLFPDIDHPKSKLGSKLKVIGWLFEHRGFFHSIFMLILISLLTFIISNKIYAAAVFLGFFSHISIDAITKQGIMPFHPISKRSIKGFVGTSSILEYLIFSAITILSIYKLISF